MKGEEEETRELERSNQLLYEVVSNRRTMDAEQRFIWVRYVTSTGCMHTRHAALPGQQIAVCTPVSVVGLLKGSQTGNSPPLSPCFPSCEVLSATGCFVQPLQTCGQKGCVSSGREEAMALVF